MCTIQGTEISDASMQCVLTLIAGQPTDGLQVEILYIFSLALSVVFILLLLKIFQLIANIGKA